MRAEGQRRGVSPAAVAASVVALAFCVLGAGGSTLARGAAPESSAAPLGLDQCETVEGLRQCTGLVPSWDGVPLDTTLTLPQSGDRRLPLVVELHGFGNSRYEYLDPASRPYTDNAYHWAHAGYAVLTYTARGLWGSCGTPDSRLANPAACAQGYIHLADERYEVRDTQELIGRLVDAGVADPRRIAVTGDSYGGGQTLALAALDDRVMLADGSLVPWRSPAGTPLRIAAAAPVIPWSDLITAAAPNGEVSATGITTRRAATTPVGVEKLTFVNAIFAAAQTATGPGQPLGDPFIPGRPMGYLAPLGLDPQADVAAWVARTDLGEPYTDSAAKNLIDQLIRFHSPYYIPADRPPAPLLLASGFTDDLFPPDEVLRFANRTRARYPDAPVSVLLGDFGHQRAANKPADRRGLLRAIHSWFGHFLLGVGARARTGTEAYVPTCPRSAPSLGPFRAPSFADLATRTLHFSDLEARTISALGGDPTVGLAIDPVTGGGNDCVSVPAGPASGTARYRLATAGERSLTLLGAPRLEAQLDVSGAAPGVAQIAARLWDVAPDGTEQLVARGLYRPHDGENRWQLHPAAWRFAPGHAAELELLGSDVPYARPSNALFSVAVDGLSVELPIRGGG